MSLCIAGGTPPFAQETGPPKGDKEKDAAKPEAQIEIKGKVINSRTGAGLANVQVTLAGPQRGAKTTDQSGSFSFSVPPGKYKVTAKGVTREVSTDKPDPVSLSVENED